MAINKQLIGAIIYWISIDLALFLLCIISVIFPGESYDSVLGAIAGLIRTIFAAIMAILIITRAGSHPSHRIIYPLEGINELLAKCAELKEDENNLLSLLFVRDYYKPIIFQKIRVLAAHSCLRILGAFISWRIGGIFSFCLVYQIAAYIIYLAALSLYREIMRTACMLKEKNKTAEKAE